MAASNTLFIYDSKRTWLMRSTACCACCRSRCIRSVNESSSALHSACWDCWSPMSLYKHKMGGASDSTWPLATDKACVLWRMRPYRMPLLYLMRRPSS